MSRDLESSQHDKVVGCSQVSIQGNYRLAASMVKLIISSLQVETSGFPFLSFSFKFFALVYE